MGAAAAPVEGEEDAALHTIVRRGAARGLLAQLIMVPFFGMMT